MVVLVDLEGYYEIILFYFKYCSFLNVFVFVVVIIVIYLILF